MTSTRPPVYNGRYELRNQVARGGTAQVYLARDIILDRPVALKVLFPELSTDHTFVERFRREAQAAANLSHPNIVPVFDWGESDRTYFIVMEYVDGEPLSSIIRSQSPLAPGNAAQVAADIAKALFYAHRHGVVHRDVKPGNVLITQDGQVKVTDFGIARAIGADEQVTQTGLVMGTATYFSPEQAQGLGVDGRSDIYSLGVVLYEMLTGRPPFAGETPVSIAYQHVQETPSRPRSVNPAIPPALEAIVLQAMAKLPAERYQSADEMRADLERFLRNQTVLAAPPSEFGGAPATEVLARATAAYGMDTTAIPATEYAAVRERRTTPYWIAAAIILIIAIVIVGVVGARSLGYLGGARYVHVPDVLNTGSKSAEQTLRTNHLKPSTHTVKTNDPTKSGQVLTENPAPQASVRTGTVIDLGVGGAVQTEQVPSVVGLSESAAKSRIQAAGLKTTVTLVPWAAGETVGQVKSQSPSSGSLPKASSVTISVVSSPGQVAVPTWSTGETQQQADVALGTAGLSAGATKSIFSSTVPQGDVISSSPAASTKVPQGTSVTLTLSKGAGIVVPNLQGLSYAQAQTQLQGLGLGIQPGASIPETNPADNQIIVQQSPTANSKLQSGNAVTVSLGQVNQTTTTTSTPLGNTGIPPGGNTGTATTTTPGL